MKPSLLFGLLLCGFLHGFMGLSLHHTTSVLVKTRETFKLADLQLLQAQVQTDSLCECRRLVLDAATGSSILQLDNMDPHFQSALTANYPAAKPQTEEEGHSYGIPSFLRSCDWVGRVVETGSTPQELVQNLRRSSSTRTLAPWTMTCLRMITSSFPVNNTTTNPVLPGYAQKTLLCAISQVIKAPAALDPVAAEDELIAVDTGEGLYLVQKFVSVPYKADHASATNLAKLWAKRPFPYSSAMNYDAAKMIVDTLAHIVIAEEKRPRLLDATCGSGTFLALAMERGMRVTGWDTNELCVQGSKRNLEFIFGSDTVEQDCDLHVRSCLEENSNGSFAYDCVASNLPWGINSSVRKDSNRDIPQSSKAGLTMMMSSIRRELPKGIPCAFVYKDIEERPETDRMDWWLEMGFQLLGTARIPQKNFALPFKGRKKKKKASPESERTGRSDCVVALVKTF